MQLPSQIRCKRVHEPSAKDDGFRALIDRIWPRGISKTDLAADGWYRELAPSSELRKWFGHEPQRWAGFYQKYHVELRERQAELAQLLEDCDGRTLTLLYAAKDTEHNNAVALKMFLEAILKSVAEDQEDLAAFEERMAESTMTLGALLTELEQLRN